MKKIISSFVLFIILGNAIAQNPKRLINTNDDVEQSFRAIKINNKVVFKAFTNAYGEELWVTDGTSLGTVLLKDFIVGPGDSFFNRSIVWNGFLYFTAYTNTNGNELWKTDGTPAGTMLVADIIAGTVSSNINSFQIMGDNLYFLGSGINNLSTLYKYDGSTVSLVYENLNSEQYSQHLIAVGNTLYFNASEYNVSLELWKSDGTTLGTSLVKALPNYYIQEMGKNNNEVFFTLDGPSGEVWKSNGTAVGTVMIQQTNQTYGIGSDFFQELNGVLYFLDNNKIYKYASGIVTIHYSGSNIKYFRSLNSEIVFVDQVFLNQKVYKTDGINTPILLKEFQKGSQIIGGISMGKTPNETIFMSIDTETYGQELWKSDGTGPGTVLVKDIQNNNLGSVPREFISINNQVVFFAKTQTEGYEPWISDGTTAGTTMIKNVQEGVLNANPRNFIVNNNQVFFSADKSFANANAQYYNGAYMQATAINNSVEKVLYNNNIFSAGQIVPSGGVELVSLSPSNFHSINPGTSSSFPANFKVFNNKLYFAATHDLYGRELWVHNAGTTSLVLDLIFGTGSSNPNTLTVMGSHLYYFITNNLSQTELIKTDGTLANTSILQGANGAGGMIINIPSGMAAISGKLFFTAKKINSTSGFELYAYNGTTIDLVADIVPGTGDSSPSNLFVVGNNLFFTAFTSLGRELYRYNVTNGTTLVRDINPGSASSFISEMFAVSATEIYFQANTLANGYELWRSDGTTAGTYLIKDINNGSSSFPAKLCKLGSWVYFSANDGKHSKELWRTDGTNSGTTLVFDLNPDIGQNQNNSNISEIVATSTKLYISATNGFNGHQLFEYTPCQIVGNNANFGNYVANIPSQTVTFDQGLYPNAKFYENRNLSFFSEKNVLMGPGFEVDASKNQVFLAEIKACF